MERQRTLLEYKAHTTRSPGAWVLAAGACSLLLALLARGAAAQTPAPQEPAPTPAPSPKPAATFTAGSWEFTLGGYVKLDLIHDFDPIGSTDSLRPPNDSGRRQRGHQHPVSREGDARCRSVSCGPVDGRELKLFVEGDFFGTDNGFRLRHAYGQYGLLLAGQTWTTFMDEFNIPHTIDFETPVAAPLVRQGLVRCDRSTLSKRTDLAFGIEESDLKSASARTGGTMEKRLPDFTTRVRFTAAAVTSSCRGLSADALPTHHRRANRRDDRGGAGVRSPPALRRRRGLCRGRVWPRIGPLSRRRGRAPDTAGRAAGRWRSWPSQAGTSTTGRAAGPPTWW